MMKLAIGVLVGVALAAVVAGIFFVRLLFDLWERQ